MDKWDKINMTSGTWERPEPPVVKFLASMAKILNNDVMVLDIGPGRSGRHSRLIEEMGLRLISVDVSHACRAHFHGNISEMSFPPEAFDVILDIKTLCQDPTPPYNLIWSWLRPGGVLFAMIPGEEHLTDSQAFDIKRRPDYEYEYVRCAGEKEIRNLLCMFSSIGLYKYVEPVRMEKTVKYLYSWCVEAQK